MTSAKKTIAFSKNKLFHGLTLLNFGQTKFFDFQEILSLSLDTHKAIGINAKLSNKKQICQIFQKNDTEQSLFEMLFLIGKKHSKNLETVDLFYHSHFDTFEIFCWLNNQLIVIASGGF